MKLEEFKRIKILKGTYVKAIYKSEYTTPKKLGSHLITKVSETIVRLGCDYKNLAQNEEKEIQPLNVKGEWVENYQNILFAKESKEEDGEVSYLVRFYSTNTPNFKPKTIYYLDGVETTKEHLSELGYLRKSKPTEEPILTYWVKLENILQLG